MATATPKQFISPTALGTIYTASLYTVPGTSTAILKEITLCNTSTSTQYVTMYVGSGSNAGNMILQSASLVPTETKFFTFSTVLTGSQTIKGGATAASVVAITISGVEIL